MNKEWSELNKSVQLHILFGIFFVSRILLHTRLLQIRNRFV